MTDKSTLSSVANLLGVGESITDIAFDKNPDGIIIVDTDGMVIKSNMAADEMFGASWGMQDHDIHEFIAMKEHREKFFEPYVKNPAKVGRAMAGSRPVEGLRQDTKEPFKCAIALGPAKLGSTRMVIVTARLIGPKQEE